jgi:hypothetical protein
LYEYKYYRKSYSLSDSFRERLAPVSCLADSPGPANLHKTTPSGLDYEGDGEFCRYPRQGQKKPERNQPLVDAAYGDKALSISQINYVIKAVEKQI